MMRLSAGLLLVLSFPGVAQPPRVAAPPVPDKYDAEIRYRIDAFRRERVADFQAMTKALKALGFRRDPEDEARGDDQLEEQNPAADRLKGTLPASAVPDVLRLRNVYTLLLKPAGSRLPAEDKPVRVEVRLAGDLGGTRQRAAAEELAAVLKPLGFRESVGYDHRGYTRLVGTLPAGKLQTLLADVRRDPAGHGRLPKTLLNDLRDLPGGADTFRAVLQEWYEHPEGYKLLLPVLQAWARQEEGRQLIAGLPPLVVNDPNLLRELNDAARERKAPAAATLDRVAKVVADNEVVREQVLDHLRRTPASAPLLDRLLADVLKSRASGELLDRLLRRVEGRAAAAVLPPVFRGRTILRVVEARPDLAPTEARPVPLLVPEGRRKLGSSLRELLDNAPRAGVARRLEIILSREPTARDENWARDLYRAAPSLLVEGRFGPVVSGLMKPSEAEALARLPSVSTVRLPREARPAILQLPDESGDSAKVLQATGIADLRKKGKPARPVSVVVVDSDFRGWQPLVAKRLPVATRLIDLTLERNQGLKADPYPDSPAALGTGTLTALAVAQAAPWCELTLVRVDPAAPYQYGLLLRRLGGELAFGESLLQRREDLSYDRQVLERDRAALLKLRNEILNLFPDDRPQDDKVADPKLKERKDRWKDYEDRQAKFDERAKTFRAVEKVYLQHLEALRGLGSARVVVNGLAWNDGHPVDNGSLLTRALEDTRRRYLWVQPAGHLRGQVWAGLFRDADGNGVMEFADARAPLPAGTWDRETAFLAFRPWKGDGAPALPAKSRLRVSLQWREAQDPDFAADGSDPYREPLANLRLVVVSQPDPEGKKRPADDLTVVRESGGLPERLQNDAGSAVYEHTAEVPVAEAGRYGVRVEGRAPKSTRPPGTNDLPVSTQGSDLKVRVLVELLDADGRVGFAHHATPTGTLPAPADAASVLVVGATDGERKAQPYSGAGSPFNVELMAKPDVRTFDRLGLDGGKNVGGTGMSAGLAAGYAAALVGRGLSGEDLVRELRLKLNRGPGPRP